MPGNGVLRLKWQHRRGILLRKIELTLDNINCLLFLFSSIYFASILLKNFPLRCSYFQAMEFLKITHFCCLRSTSSHLFHILIKSADIHVEKYGTLSEKKIQ